MGYMDMVLAERFELPSLSAGGLQPLGVTGHHSLAIGGAKGPRSPDILLDRQALFLLSYGPEE